MHCVQHKEDQCKPFLYRHTIVYTAITVILSLHKLGNTLYCALTQLDSCLMGHHKHTVCTHSVAHTFITSLLPLIILSIHGLQTAVYTSITSSKQSIVIPYTYIVLSTIIPCDCISTPLAHSTVTRIYTYSCTCIHGYIAICILVNMHFDHSTVTNYTKCKRVHFMQC